jgi:hypothetical protein
MKVTEADIEAFAEFARERTAGGAADLTIAELAAEWQAARERHDMNRAIAESLDDIEAGHTEPFVESQDRFRRERSLPPRQ